MSDPIGFFDTRKYNKSNYDDVIRKLIPSVYFEEDEKLVSGLGSLDIIAEVIDCQVNIVKYFSSIINIPVDAFTGTIFSSINTTSAIYPYFIKQGKLFNVSYRDFQEKILKELTVTSVDHQSYLKDGRSFYQFPTSSAFSYYVSSELLPSIKLGNPTAYILKENYNLPNNINPSRYLMETIPGLFILNLPTQPVNVYNSSSYVHDLIVNNLYASKDVTTKDILLGITEYVWRNYTTCAVNWSKLNLIPSVYKSTSPIDALTTEASSLSKLESLKTLVKVVYSDSYSDRKDLRIKIALESSIAGAYKTPDKVKHGPLSKLLKAFSFAFADYDDPVDNLDVLYNINECPDEYLPYLANLIGWKLFGSNTDRWRLQISNAIEVYKRIGTKKSIQYAINSIFPADQFNLSSLINEQWESYVPFLIYYSLATESLMLSSFETWTRPISRKLGVSAYSYSSMDDNIRLTVDQILYELVKEYPRSFVLSNDSRFAGAIDTDKSIANWTSFPLGTSSFSFNYRGRDFPIPPFEEYPYYANVTLSYNIILSIMDKLVCFGVPQVFAEKVADYIRSNSLESTDALRSDNKFILFTASALYPPNWDEVIKDISNRKIQYFPLWNSKSSHFSVLFDTSSFDFTKNTLEIDSREAFGLVSDNIKSFSPAHSIPIIAASVSAVDYASYENVTLPYLGYDELEFSELSYASGACFAGFATSAIPMSRYKRGIGATLLPFKREDVDSLVDPLVSISSITGFFPRRDHRRRDTKFTLPKDGFYDKTGFNMPLPFSNYATGTIFSGDFLPLGVIPSSQDYVHIPDYNNIHPIWDKCENLSSKNYYSGLWVSNTYPCRGWRGVESNEKHYQMGKRPDYYQDLNQLHPIISVMHYIKEQTKLFEASSYYYYNPDYYNKNNYWKNVLGSYANNSTELSGNFPNSFSDYTSFKFGRDWHKFYSQYRNNFNTGRQIRNVLNLDGPTIFGHTFGSIFKNSTFSENGSLTIDRTDLITTQFVKSNEFVNGSGVFSDAGIESSGTSLVDGIFGKEYINSGILDHIELCQSVSSSNRNSFSIYRLDKNGKDPEKINPLWYNNTIIQQKVAGGFGRIRFDISKFASSPNQLYDKTYNFLTPEHNFKLSLKALVSNTEGGVIGNGGVGVWIHTEEEDGSYWSFKNNKWIQHKKSVLTNQTLIRDYINIIPGKPRPRPPNLKCAKYIDKYNPNRFNELLNSFSEDEFTDIVIEFNTRNQALCEDPDTQLITPPDYYRNVAAKVHRLNQRYIIEVFSVPYTDDNFALLYNFNLIDQTLNRWSKPLVGGIQNNRPFGELYCPEFRIDLTREQVMTIIKYFNKLSGVYNNFGYASRIASQTSSIYEASGGSRINFIQSPYWVGGGTDSALSPNCLYLSSLIIRN